MNKIISQFFSMRMMALGMFAFLIAIGAATILESVYDIQTAKLMVYNATWFEILLVYLSFNLISNIFKYQLYRKEKIASFTFHVSFLIILIGAGITRYISFEGLMLVREGESSNFIYSSDPFIWMKINDGKLQYVYKEKLLQSEQYNNKFQHTVNFPEHKSPIDISFVRFQKKMVDSLVIDKKFDSKVLEIVTGGMNSNHLEKGGFLLINNIALSFEQKGAMPGIHVTEEKGKYFFTSCYDISFLPMTQMQAFRQSGEDVPDSAYTLIPKDTRTQFEQAVLYKVENEQFVFKSVISNAMKMLMPSGSRNIGSDYLTLKLKDGNETKEVILSGGAGQIPSSEVFSFGGLTYEMEYGATKIQLPFSIECRDFELDRYPGSDAPSSFASQVTVIDPKNNVNEKHRIFMNNVIDYGGYRFFQSGYDEDELGTHLSVNHDSLGTNVTYIGYLLMTIGMILALFVNGGRFADVRTKLAKIRAKKELLTLFIVVSFSAFGQDNHVHDPSVPHSHDTEQHDHSDHDHSDHDHTGHDHAGHDQADQSKSSGVKEEERKIISAQFITPEHSEKLGSMAVQDFRGRIIPMHTLCDQLLRKVNRSEKYQGRDAVTTILSMHMYPEFWMNEKIIYVEKVLFDALKVKENHCTFKQISDGDGTFILLDEYNKAFQKLEKNRGEFDKKLIKLVERFQIVNQIFMWSYMKIIPVKEDKNNTWFVPLSQELEGRASDISNLVLRYLSAVDKAGKEGNFSAANQLLEEFKNVQRKEGSAVIPSKSHIDVEISYNKMSIFKNTSYLYLLFGITLLVVFFIRIFKNPQGQKAVFYNRINSVFRWLLVATSLYHAAGLAMRWYITGHAPWSNGYEAVIFIALVTMIAGFIFSRKNAAILAGTALLACMMVIVTEMNLMDPEITPLQPVLKSYWLMIHVAIITGSYGFLGLGAILGLLNLTLYILRKNNETGKRISLNINELTYVSEMTITVGLFMLTIGTFLGGIWANESWGRYWGWDPKETWALVSVLVYAVILHFRFIPGMNSKFVFNVSSLWGYSAILFTFFGVNFYLTGLHSYAQGDELAKIPNWLYVTVFVFLIFTIYSFLRNRQYKKLN